MYDAPSFRIAPVPPRDLLKKFHVSDPIDTRFRSAARLLQSMWREQRQLEAGTYLRADMSARMIGSRLATQPASTGFNYLSADVAKLVRQELAYRERGALIDEDRIWENLLSSSALAFNAFGPLKLNAALAKTVLKAVTGDDIKLVTGVFFETSPGRGRDEYIGDNTALDVLITYNGKDGSKGFIGIEVKYAESAPTWGYPARQRLRDEALGSGLFRPGSMDELTQPRFRQFFAEHTLCFSMVGQNKPFDHAASLSWRPQ